MFISHNFWREIAQATGQGWNFQVGMFQAIYLMRLLCDTLKSYAFAVSINEAFSSKLKYTLS